MNPTMFVENQIGATNPHDKLLPTESANIIKSHVVDGVN
jgi:membrane-associated HD superfamily phosphohydrolase